MHRRTTQEFMRKLANKYGVSAATVLDIARSPFRFLADVVMDDINPSKGYYPGFMVKGLGKFVVTEGKKEMLLRKHVLRLQKKETL